MTNSIVNSREELEDNVRAFMAALGEDIGISDLLAEIQQIHEADPETLRDAIWSLIDQGVLSMTPTHQVKIVV